SRACPRLRLHDAPIRSQGVIMKYMLLIYDNADTRELFFGPEGKALGEEIEALMAELTASGEFVGGEALAQLPVRRDGGAADDERWRTGRVTSPGAPDIEGLLRQLGPQVLGALARRHGQFEACEDATQEALLAAARQWPRQGVPDHPRGWLTTVATRKLIDDIRADSSRRAREDAA